MSTPQATYEQQLAMITVNVKHMLDIRKSGRLGLRLDGPDHYIMGEHVLALVTPRKISTKEAKKLGESINQDHFILVTHGKLSSSASKFLSNRFEFEHFQFPYFKFRLLDHVYVPKHVLLPESAAEELAAGYKLPKISKGDPVARYFNAKPGQVFKIYRQDGMYFRQVV